MRGFRYYIYSLLYNLTKRGYKRGYLFFYNSLISIIRILNHVTWYKGITNEKYFQEDLIVSLTTYGRRIEDVFITIESIFCGKCLPNRIILWVDESFEKVQLPQSLRRLQKKCLEIRFTKDILSYKKLIPTLKEYPYSIVVTIDDDAIYSPLFLYNLLSSYNKQPHFIHANRVHEIALDDKGIIKKYTNWRWNVIEEGPNVFYMQTGVGGVLYPPHSLSDEVFNEDVFMNICRYGDDIWFYAMAVINGVIIYKAHTEDVFGQDYVDIINPKEQALSHHNTDPIISRNDDQIKAVFSRYNILNKLLS